MFEDDVSRFEYVKINPRIGELLVKGNKKGEEDIEFSSFINLYFGRTNFLKYYDTVNYSINYGKLPGERSMSEFIDVVNKQTGVAEFQFVIQYDKLENLSSDKYLNLGSFTAIFVEE